MTQRIFLACLLTLGLSAFAHADQGNPNLKTIEAINFAPDGLLLICFVDVANAALYLASDEASIADVVAHAIESVAESYHYAVLLQATSPLRTAGDIDACIRACVTANAPSAVTLTVADKNPRWMFTMTDDGRLHPNGTWEDLRRRRQDFSPAYVVNGAAYVVRVDWFLRTRSFFCPETVGVVMPKERSVDIDSAIDLALARALIQ